MKGNSFQGRPMAPPRPFSRKREKGRENVYFAKALSVMAVV
jgi:hypothetical protein